MNLRSILASLFGAAAAGRSAVPRPPRLGKASLDSTWASLLAQLRLPASAFRDVLESGSLHPHFHYRHFAKAKRLGGRRKILAPDAKLMQVQRTILARYLEDQKAHSAAVAYRKGKSTADHAWAHAGSEVLITADVRDFFPSTPEWRIERWWLERIEDEDLARLLTRLTTYQGGLPQGAPTSPALSNFVNREMDERLMLRTLAVGGRYTRYCDDLAFSWRHASEPPADFEIGVRSLLHEFGYTLHPQKGWCVQLRRDEPKLVGVILTRRGRVRLPEDVRQTMRVLARSKDPRDADRLLGYQGYERMVTRMPKESPVHRSPVPQSVGEIHPSEPEEDIPF